MNIRSAFFLCAAVAVAPLALASPPPPPAPITGETLGQLQGILSFCTRINPSAAPIYKSLGKAVTGIESSGDIKKTEGTDSYHAAFQAVVAALDKLPHGEALKSCSSVQAPVKEVGHPREHDESKQKPATRR
jgi:hypothetical protein